MFGHLLFRDFLYLLWSVWASMHDGSSFSDDEDGILSDPQTPIIQTIDACTNERERHFLRKNRRNEPSSSTATTENSRCTLKICNFKKSTIS